MSGVEKMTGGNIHVFIHETTLIALKWQWLVLLDKTIPVSKSAVMCV